MILHFSLSQLFLGLKVAMALDVLVDATHLRMLYLLVVEVLAIETVEESTVVADRELTGLLHSFDVLVLVTNGSVQSATLAAHLIEKTSILGHDLEIQYLTLLVAGILKYQGIWSHDFLREICDLHLILKIDWRQFVLLIHSLYFVLQDHEVFLLIGWITKVHQNNLLFLILVEPFKFVNIFVYLLQVKFESRALLSLRMML